MKEQNSKMQDVILITTYYPPVLSIASNRMIAFARYLDKTKYRTTIITIGKKDEEDFFEGNKIYRICDDGFLKKAKFDKESTFVVHKLKALYNRFVMLLPINEHESWKKRAIKKIEEIASKMDNPIIISSYAPVEPHLVALQVCKKNGYSWVADMRDEMSTNPHINKNDRKAFQKIENEIFKYAKAITTVSKPILDDFKNANQVNKNLKFAEVRNGYDFDLEETISHNEKFTIMYAGNFYGKRKPDIFFKAVGELIEEKKIEKPIIDFIGAGNGIIIPEKLKEYFSKTGKIAYSQTIKKLKSADTLLLILPKLKQKGVYSGKLFDYLGCLKPIIAIVDPEDVAAELITKCNAGFIGDISNIEDVKKAILDSYNLWQSKKHLNFDIEMIKSQHRKEQIKELNSILQKIENE